MHVVCMICALPVEYMCRNKHWTQGLVMDTGAFELAGKEGGFGQNHREGGQPAAGGALAGVARDVQQGHCLGAGWFPDHQSVRASQTH